MGQINRKLVITSGFYLSFVKLVYITTSRKGMFYTRTVWGPLVLMSMLRHRLDEGVMNTYHQTSGQDLWDSTFSRMFSLFPV